MSNHTSSDNPLPSGRMNMKKHDKIIIKEKCYGRIDESGDSEGTVGRKAVY